VASIKKRDTGTWRAQVAIRGVRQSKDFSTKSEAVAWSNALESSLREAHSSGIIVGVKVQAAFDRYVAEISVHKKGHRWEKVRLAKLARDLIDGVILGEMLLSEVTPDTIAAWRDAHLAKGRVSGSTINREMNLLSHVMTVAKEEWKWLATNPVSGVRRPKEAAARDRLISAEEIERICISLGFTESSVTTKTSAVAAAFLFAIETGMRAGEICKLQPDWIKGAVVHLPADVVKNGVKRDVALSKRALELLSYLPQDTLFGMNSASLDALFRKGRDRAGVEGLHFHDTRHEAITRLAKKLDVLELARMVGHKDIRMLQVYFNATAASIAARLD
jgi:integrase